MEEEVGGWKYENAWSHLKRMREPEEMDEEKEEAKLR